MARISLDQFRRTPLECLQSIRAGETIILVEAGRDLAEIRPLTDPQQGQRPFGLCAGEFSVPDDFDDPLPGDVLQDFNGP